MRRAWPFATEVLGYVPVDEWGLLYSLRGDPGRWNRRPQVLWG